MQPERREEGRDVVVEEVVVLEPEQWQDGEQDSGPDEVFLVAPRVVALYEAREYVCDGGDGEQEQGRRGHPPGDEGVGDGEEQGVGQSGAGVLAAAQQHGSPVEEEYDGEEPEELEGVEYHRRL